MDIILSSVVLLGFFSHYLCICYSCTGNNIYGFDVREALIRLKKEGGDALSAYILMQRIFPKSSLANLVRGGVCHEALAVSELGIYGAYLRYNKCLKHRSPNTS